ncbi:unnamed protein product [Urochloa decumbens]|uniref:Phospholipase A1 n=1 Tax=Urochloa decumbens TaxID=240449 RepID=A0ABC8YD71_9POAL
MVQTAEDGLNTEERSPHVGACLYGYSDLLRATGAAAAAGRYEVTKFLYATSGVAAPCPFLQIGDGESNFMGYVAVATDEGAAALGRRDIVVHEEVKRLMEFYKDEAISITITGHSLGAALSILTAVDIVANGLNVPPGVGRRPPCPVTAIVFACPRIGNPAFSDAFGSFRDLKALHVRNEGDPVHNLPPPKIVNIEYADVGVPLDIHTDRSPYLSKLTDDMELEERLARVHNLECYLHGVAGEQGAAGGFKLEVNRDVALVNKSTDALIPEEHHVPANWWVAQNKRMVQGADGHWKLNDFVHI